MLFEDSPADARLTRRALGAAGWSGGVVIERSGDSGLGHLFERVSRGAAPTAILVDLNLPGLDGFGVLDGLRSTRATAGIPAVVLSTSESDDDMLSAYARQARAYIVKPDSYDALCEAMRGFVRLWCEPERASDACGVSSRRV